MHTFVSYMLLLYICVTEALTEAALADPSVVELAICDFKAWLMDADLAPCSLSVPFSIYQPRDVS